MKITIALWLAIAIMFATAAATAAPITFSLSTTGSGTFNGTPFSDNTLTLTQVTDTSDITFDSVIPEYFAAFVTTNTVTVAGVGSGTLTEITFFDDNQNSPGSINFGDEGFGNALLDVILSQGMTYNLQSSLGPVSAPIANGIGTFTVPTSSGTLSFTANSTNATFQAVLDTSGVPEPGTFGLLIAGATLLAAGRLRNRKK